MTVFRYYFKILNKNKAMVILYTVLLLVFAGSNLQTSDNSTNFVASKPDVYVINEDEGGGLSEVLCEYIEENAVVKEPKKEENIIDEDAVSDALFYRDVNYIIYIPKNFSEDFLAGDNPKVSVKSTGDYQASYMELLLERFLEVAGAFSYEGVEEEQLFADVKEVLDQKVEIEMTTKLDTTALSKATFFFNFANYSLLAGCVYVIAIILSSFRQEIIQKRTVISVTKYTKVNGQLLLANGVFAFMLWAFYVVISMLLVKDVMFTTHGLLYIANSFVFALCALSIGFLIGNITSNKGALSGIVNVVALGSSFLCGAFVPMEFLPGGVLKVARILPSYWYIQNNELIAKIETFDKQSIQPLCVNGLIVVGFMVVFVIVTNVISKKKRVL